MTTRKHFSKSLQRLALVATTPDDSHVWNLIGVQLKLEERGFHVENLGACTPLTELIEAIMEQRPALLALSSVNGHGAISIRALLAALEEAGLLGRFPIVAGGLLTTDPEQAARAAAELRQLGCAGVFVGEQAWTQFDAWLTKLDAGKTTNSNGWLFRQKTKSKPHLRSRVRKAGHKQTHFHKRWLVGGHHGH